MHTHLHTKDKTCPVIPNTHPRWIWEMVQQTFNCSTFVSMTLLAFHMCGRAVLKINARQNFLYFHCFELFHFCIWTKSSHSLPPCTMHYRIAKRQSRNTMNINIFAFSLCTRNGSICAASIRYGLAVGSSDGGSATNNNNNNSIKLKITHSNGIFIGHFYSRRVFCLPRGDYNCDFVLNSFKLHLMGVHGVDNRAAQAQPLSCNGLKWL